MEEDGSDSCPAKNRPLGGDDRVYTATQCACVSVFYHPSLPSPVHDPRYGSLIPFKGDILSALLLQ